MLASGNPGEKRNEGDISRGQALFGGCLDVVSKISSENGISDFF